MLGDTSESVKQQQPVSNVASDGILRPAGISDIMDTGSDAKPNNRPKSLQKASKILKSKRYAICSGTALLTVHQCNGMAR